MHHSLTRHDEADDCVAVQHRWQQQQNAQKMHRRRSALSGTDDGTLQHGRMQLGNDYFQFFVIPARFVLTYVRQACWLDWYGNFGIIFLVLHVSSRSSPNLHLPQSVSIRIAGRLLSSEPFYTIHIFYACACFTLSQY